MRRLRKATFAIVLLALQGAGTLDDRGSKEDQQACTPDVFRLCTAWIPDEPAILACLQAKKLDLSPGCARVLFPDRPAGTTPPKR